MDVPYLKEPWPCEWSWSHNYSQPTRTVLMKAMFYIAAFQPVMLLPVPFYILRSNVHRWINKIMTARKALYNAKSIVLSNGRETSRVRRVYINTIANSPPVQLILKECRACIYTAVVYFSLRSVVFTSVIHSSVLLNYGITCCIG